MKRTNVIVILISMIVIFYITVLLVFAVLGGINLSKDYTDNAQNQGLSVENISKNEFCVDEDGVKFYYKKSLLGLKFTKYEFHMGEGEGLSEDSEEADVQVEAKPFNKFSVSVDTDGSYMSFNCGKDFSSSLETPATDPTGNRRDAYKHITTHYYSQEQFISTYETAIDIRDQITGM